MHTLTVEEVEREVKALVAIVDDPEEYHYGRDILWEAVLEAIEEGHPTPSLLAQAALKTNDTQPRWWACA